MKIVNFNSTELFIKNYNGEKLTSPKQIKIKTLTEKDIDSLYQLQNNVLHELGPDQTLINDHSKEDFKKYMDEGFIVGAFDKDQIIGTISFKKNHDFEVNVKDIYLNEKDFGCLGSLMVQKEYRNNKITQYMINHIMQQVKEKFGIENFISYIDGDNPKSYTNFHQMGFGISHVYFDPVFHAKSYAFVYTKEPKAKKQLYFANTNELESFGYMYSMITHKNKKQKMKNLPQKAHITNMTKFIINQKQKIKG